MKKTVHAIPLKMPFGKYRGQDMEDVPAKYLMWLRENGISGPVREYIDKNINGIKKQIADGLGGGYFKKEEGVLK